MSCSKNAIIINIADFSLRRGGGAGTLLFIFLMYFY